MWWGGGLQESVAVEGALGAGGLLVHGLGSLLAGRWRFDHEVLL